MGYWSDLYVQLQADLAAGNWRTSSYSIAGRSRSFQSLIDFMEFFNEVKYQAASETGTAAGRTAARPNASKQ